MPDSSREQKTSLHVLVKSHGIDLDAALHDDTDRFVRFAMARFGSVVRVRVVYSQPASELPMCTITAVVWPTKSLIVRFHAATFELAFRGALRQSDAEIARALRAATEI